MPGKGKTVEKEERSIEQYCSVCKKAYEMPVVEEAENNDVIWLKCPGCEGFLPYMVEPQGGSEEKEGSGPEDLAIEDLDTDSAREYDESEEYEVGEIIYHRSWNDFGKIVSKEVLPGNRKTIIVNFVNQGKIRLLEGIE